MAYTFRTTIVQEHYRGSYYDHGEEYIRIIALSIIQSTSYHHIQFDACH
jgi:hypothetical protein